ncbi:hypothetical protein GGI07_005788 [Coemansia sp. Benny D115]|nr:hypothetical protein GGI07_005788 [Coemansia sp. Benny D115]
MEASRSTIIKTILARQGPKTAQQLFLAAKNGFPNEFGQVSRSKFKNVYLKNLKEFKHIVAKPVRDPELMKKLLEDPESRAAGNNNVFVYKICENIAAKYMSGEVDLLKSSIKIVDAIDAEKAKSKDFWEGKTNTPHYWKSVLEAAGEKVKL